MSDLDEIQCKYLRVMLLNNYYFRKIQQKRSSTFLMGLNQIALSLVREKYYILEIIKNIGKHLYHIT